MTATIYNICIPLPSEGLRMTFESVDCQDEYLIVNIGINALNLLNYNFYNEHENDAAYLLKVQIHIP